MSRSEELIQELESSDFVVIATPMHNFTVPVCAEGVDRSRRSSPPNIQCDSEGKVGALRDRPVFVAVSSGGRFSGERAHQPDFLTPYLKAILGTIGLHDLTFFPLKDTALGPGCMWLKPEPRPIKRCRRSFSVSRAIRGHCFNKLYERR